MPRGRSSAGLGRMDAAIDHFTPMGYKKDQVRSAVNSLLKVYGKQNGMQPWALLEDNCYQVVQDVLFEKQEEEEKLQLQLLQEQQQSEEEDVQEEGGDQEQQHEEDEEEEAPQEAAMQEAPLENDMAVVSVHTDVPSEAVPALEEEEEVVPMTIDGPERPPCYGWISELESDSDYEDHFVNRQSEATVPTPVGQVDGM